MKQKKRSSRPKPKSRTRVVRKRPTTSPKRVGLFGGSFDPFHNGHFNSIKTVARALKLDQVRVVPAFQSPLRQPVQGSAPEHRLEITRLGVQGLGETVVVDDREIIRGGASYTIDTIRELKEEMPKSQFFLIIGMDQFENFDQWRDYEEILGSVDLIVTTRPGLELPISLAQFPGGLRPLVKKFNERLSKLKSGHAIHFVELEDVDVSATEIRRRMRSQLPITDLVPSSVEEYVKRHALYETLNKTIGDFERFTSQCAQWLAGKGAINIQGFDLRDLNGPTEYTLIASGTSTRHTSALAEFLSREVKDQLGVWPQGTEGLGEGRWVVLDYGSLIVHIFYDYVRQEYRLEDLWANGTPLKLPSLAPAVSAELSSVKPVPRPT